MVGGGAKEESFCDMWRLHDIQIAMPVNEVLLEHSHTNLFIYCLLSMAQMVVTETIWSQSLKSVLSGSLRKHVMTMDFRSS